MNAIEQTAKPDAAASMKASAHLPRRHFLGLCTYLFGTLGLAPLVTAVGQPGPGGGADAGVRALNRGPRERALREADLYRPHNLAG